MKRRWRRARLLGVGTVLALVATACLGAHTPVRVTGFNAPDPAAVATTWGGAQVYTTNTYFWGARYNVPTFGWSYTSTAVVPNNTTDALPNLPAWVKRNPLDSDVLVWAPAVRRLNNKYVMHFGGSRVDGAMCIGTATSTVAAGPFTPSPGRWCDSDSAVGQLDPYIFTDSGDGTVWAYWSRQRYPNGGSQIMVQQLTSDGLNRIGSPKVLLSHDQVAPYVPNRGSTSFLENPAMVKDPHNGYTLLVSIGTWHGNGTYHTFQIPCLNRTDFCSPGHGGTVPLSTAGITNTGGASLLFDSSPQDNYLIYHARTPGFSDGTRIGWRAKTYAFENNPPAPADGPDTRLADFKAGAVRSVDPEAFPPGSPVWDRPEREVVGSFDG